MTSRRAFMRKVALAGGALGLFPWLEERAAAGAPPPRLLLWYTPHGTIWDQWRPTGGETGFTFSPILAPLERHRDRLVIVDGIGMQNGTEYYIPHTYTMPVMWTGSPIDTSGGGFCRDDHGGRCFSWGTGTSIDQTIATRLADPSPYPTIELGYGCGGLHPANRMIYAAPGTPKTPIDDPVRAFDTLFGVVDPDAEAAARLAFRRQSVLDLVREDFNSRRGNLSATDRARLDAHAQSLSDLERALGPTGVTCTRPSSPLGVTPETAIDRQSDLIASIFGCGLTRVASFQLRIADNDNSLYPWAGLSEGGHHSLTHDSSAAGILAGVYRWYSDRFAYLLDRLAETPDVDGTTVLENTLVVWGSELGIGWTHDISNIPFIFAGGAGGRLRGGRYLRVSGMWSNRVLVTAAHAMGLSDINSYGSLDSGSGPVPGVLT